MNLYDLTGNWQKVYDMDLDEETWFDTLTSIDEAIEDKAENIAKLIRSLDADVEAYNNEIKRLSDRKRVAENKIKSVKAYLQSNMEQLGKEKFKTELFSFGIQNNPAGVDITNEQAIPVEFITVETVKKIDKRGLIQALKDGEDISGAELKQSRSLRIR